MADGVKVTWQGREVEFAVRERAVEALHEVGDFLLAKAKETVPKATGDLEASGHADVDASSLEVRVAYSEPYAVIQHEDTDYHHEGAGRAKWLQLSFDENKDQAFELLAARARL